MGKVTWRRPGGREKSAIDYIIYDKDYSRKIKEIVIDEEKDIDINTDHNMIIIKYESQKQYQKINKEISTKVKWKRKNVDWKKFKK